MKTTVNKYDTIYMVYYSTKDDPNYEMTQAFINKEDALSKRDELLRYENIYMAYISKQILW